MHEVSASKKLKEHSEQAGSFSFNIWSFPIASVRPPYQAVSILVLSRTFPSRSACTAAGQWYLQVGDVLMQVSILEKWHSGMLMTFFHLYQQVDTYMYFVLSNKDVPFETLTSLATHVLS